MSPSGHKATVDGHISAMIRGRDQCSDTKGGCVQGQSLKGKGVYKGWNSHPPSGGVPQSTSSKL